MLRIDKRYIAKLNLRSKLISFAIKLFSIKFYKSFIVKHQIKKTAIEVQARNTTVTKIRKHNF